MTSLGERLLLVLAPVLAVGAVALGLRVGAGSRVRAALVFAAPPSDAGTGLAWQIVTFDDDRGVREPTSLPDVEVRARAGGVEANWAGSTNDDGTAEVLLGLPSADGVTLEVRSGGALLAGGDAAGGVATTWSPPASAWARFARREGRIALDVAVLGLRGASGFPASVWVRATDPVTHEPLAGAAIELDADASLSSSLIESTTDALGWAHLRVTPMGYAVPLILHSHASDGRTGTWAGALFISPGAAELRMRDRYGPEERPAIEVVVPNVRRTAYVEVDDAHGRAWAAALPLVAGAGEMPYANAEVPSLSPGLYWAVASGDPAGAATLAPGTAVRPFFVAASDEQALAFGTDREECRPALDPRDNPRTVARCLALTGATPVARWTALDGFTAQRARGAQRRTLGLAIAVGALVAAGLLEIVLLLRSSYAARARLRAASLSEGDDGARWEEPRPGGRLAVALLVAMLGFALLAAFLVRAG